MKRVPHLSFSTDNLKDWKNDRKDNVLHDDDDDRRPGYNPYRPQYGEGSYSGAPTSEQSHFDD